MAYEMVMPYHLHMPSYFLETFTEYPFLGIGNNPMVGCTVACAVDVATALSK